MTNESTVPDKVWDAVSAFAKLARGHEREIGKAVRGWLASDKGGKRPDAFHLAVVRLVAANDLIAYKAEREARLAGIEPMASELHLSEQERIILATLILGRWGTKEETAITDALDLVAERWRIRLKAAAPATESQKIGCLIVYDDFRQVLCHKTHYDLTDAAQARELLRFLCTKEARSEINGRKKSDILKALKAAGVVVVANDWRPSSVFRGKLLPLYKGAIGRNTTKGLYWINP